MKNDAMRIGVVFAPDAPIYSPEKTSDDAADVYFGPLLRGLSAAAEEHGLELVYTRLAPSEYLQFARAQSVNGLILLTFGLDDFEELSVLRSNKIPHVVVGVSAPKGAEARFPCVDASNIEGGRMAAKHLLELGHRKLACVNLAGNFANHCDRMHGFLQEIKDEGITVDFDRVFVDEGYVWPLFEDQMADWIRALIDRDNLPTAIFACDYLMAEALYKVLHRFDLNIPSDISVIAFDDPPPGRLMTPPLTTVRQPIETIAARAVGRLVEALADRAHPSEIVGPLVLPTELIVRESTSAPAV